MGCAPTQAPTPTTQAPTTQAPTTQAPTTQAPTTKAPTNGTVIQQFPAGGRSYSQSQQLCSSKSLVICPKWRICPSGPHNQPVGGSMHGDVWIPIADTVSDWVQIGNAGHVLCAGHSERGYGLPHWGLGHNPYNQRIYCCDTPPTAAPV